MFFNFPNFDPFGFAEKAFPRGRSRLLTRIVVIGFLLLFLLHRLAEYRTYLFKPLWAAETLILLVFIVAYTVRRDPVDRARGLREILVPLVGGLMPFALLVTPPARAVIGSYFAVRLVFCVMTLSTLFTLWALWSLRRSFSITVEAREVVREGPYRWIRHPVYLGEIVTAGAVATWRFSLANVAIFALFVVVQLARARWEEEKLGRALPRYASYAAATVWFWRYRRPAGRCRPESSC